MSISLKKWTAPNKGALFVVTGPSGTGKTTLVRHALKHTPHISFSISATTRPARDTEKDGVDYHFWDTPTFRKKVEDKEFLEWAKVYDNFYGTPKEPIMNALNKGESILLDIDPQGAAQVRARMPECVSIFILPPSIEIVEKRLRNRNTDSEEVISARMLQIREQLQHCQGFDYLLINDDLQSAQDQFQAILIATLLQRSHRNQWIERFTS
ncbi:MAG: guanylate kinase [Deltaproteobacteria bacterium]|nr:guanylate kinase [Deltaproteobacteria bacterium]